MSAHSNLTQGDLLVLYQNLKSRRLSSSRAGEQTVGRTLVCECLVLHNGRESGASASVSLVMIVKLDIRRKLASFASLRLEGYVDGSYKYLLTDKDYLEMGYFILAEVDERIGDCTGLSDRNTCAAFDEQ